MASTGVQTHFNRRDMLLREIIKRTSTVAAAAGLGTVELLTGIGSVIRRPVRRIVLVE